MKRFLAVFRNTRKRAAGASSPSNGLADSLVVWRLAIILIGLLISGSFLQSSLLAGQKADDADNRISDQVRMRLATDADVKGGALDVSVKDGVVVIKGRVDSDKGKNKATHLAKKVKGVKEVDNELVVGPPKN